jgi:hypothetical protein
MSTIYTSFITVNGRIRAEVSTSPLKTQIYLQDCLGNVTEAVDTTTNSNLVYRTRYRVYGDRATAVSTGVPAQNQFVGALGIRRTGRSHANAYVRARYYSHPPFLIRPDREVRRMSKGEILVERS